MRRNYLDCGILVRDDALHCLSSDDAFAHAGWRFPFDHKHRHVSDKGVPYGFESAYQLLEDFFKDVDRVLQEVRKS